MTATFLRKTINKNDKIRIEVKKVFLKKRDREIALTLKERAIQFSQKQRHRLA